MASRFGTIRPRAPALSPLRMIPLGLLFILGFLVAVGTAVRGRLVDAGGDNLLTIAGIGLAFVGALTSGVRFGRAW